MYKLKKQDITCLVLSFKDVGWWVLLPLDRAAAAECADIRLVSIFSTNIFKNGRKKLGCKECKKHFLDLWFGL